MSSDLLHFIYLPPHLCPILAYIYHSRAGWNPAPLVLSMSKDETPPTSPFRKEPALSLSKGRPRGIYKIPLYPPLRKGGNSLNFLLLLTPHFQKISKNVFPRLGHERLRVELDAFHRVLFVLQPHNFIIVSPGGNLKTVRQSLPLHHQ